MSQPEARTFQLNDVFCKGICEWLSKPANIDDLPLYLAQAAPLFLEDVRSGELLLSFPQSKHDARDINRSGYCRNEAGAPAIEIYMPRAMRPRARNKTDKVALHEEIGFLAIEALDFYAKDLRIKTANSLSPSPQPN